MRFGVGPATIFAMTSPLARGTPTAIDLFAGCGGLTHGLAQAGFSILAAVEVDELAADTYQLNHPDVLLVRRDIRKVRPDRLMTRLRLRPKQLTLLAGCPPCQGFSSIRRLNKSNAVDDPRNDLVSQMLKFTKKFVPKAIMMENVPGLANDERFVSLVSQLEKLGYRCTELILDAAHYGVPQRRRRLVLLAGLGVRLSMPDTTSSRTSVRQTIAGLGAVGTSGDPLHDVTERSRATIKRLIASIPKDGGSRAQVRGGDGLKCHKEFDGFKDVYGRIAWDGVAPTITGGCVNPSKGRFLHPNQNRAITLREAALLQGFPTGYRISLKRGKFPAAGLIGNALPPPLARAQGRKILEDLGLAVRV